MLSYTFLILINLPFIEEKTSSSSRLQVTLFSYANYFSISYSAFRNICFLAFSWVLCENTPLNLGKVILHLREPQLFYSSSYCIFTRKWRDRPPDATCCRQPGNRKSFHVKEKFAEAESIKTVTLFCFIMKEISMQTTIYIAKNWI